MNADSSRECVKGTGVNTRGFTLIEMLVVLLIMGLMVGMVSAIARPDDRALLQVEATRLAALLNFVAAQSRLTGKSMAWTANGPDYRFWQFQEETGWSDASESDLLRARILPQGMMISDLRVETMRPQGNIRLEFIPYGSTLAFTIELSLGAERYAVAASPVGDAQALPSEGNTNGYMALR